MISLHHYDDHCHLTFEGRDWLISAKRGNNVLARTMIGSGMWVETVIDLSKANFSEYCDRAVAAIHRHHQ